MPPILPHIASRQDCAVESYGLNLTAGLAERLTTCCLLQKYARLSDFIARHPIPDGAAFHRALWGDL